MKIKEHLKNKLKGYTELKDITFNSRSVHVRDNKWYFLACIVNDRNLFRGTKIELKNKRIRELW